MGELAQFTRLIIPREATNACCSWREPPLEPDHAPLMNVPFDGFRLVPVDHAPLIHVPFDEFRLVSFDHILL